MSDTLVRTGLRRVSPRVLLPCLLLLSAAGCKSDARDPVVFGLAAPLETPYGASMRLGAELARREINESGGIRGRALELRALDDQADPQVAINVADALYRDRAVVAVVGHVNSGTMTAAAPMYQQGLAAVATSATSPSISRLGEWVFRVASSDSANAVELARLAHRMGERTAVLYANDDYGRGLAESFRSALLAQGGALLETDPYLEETQDFTPYLERLRARGVGLIFIAGLEEGAARIIQQARRLGLRARFLGGDGLEGLATMGDAYDGTLVGLLYHPDASPQARAFAQRFRAAYEREPDSFAALGYDATRLLAAAAAAGGPERAAIQRQLARVGDDAPVLDGVTGTIKLDANGDPLQKGFAVGELRTGRYLLNDQL